MLREFRSFHKMREVEPFNGSSDLTTVLTHILIGKGNSPEGWLSFDQAAPVCFFSDPHWGDRTDSCDDDALFAVPHVPLPPGCLVFSSIALPFVKTKTRSPKKSGKGMETDALDYQF